MKIGESTLLLAERMNVDAQVEEMAERLQSEQQAPGLLETTVAAIEDTSTFKAWVPFTEDWEQRWDKYKRPDAVEDFNRFDYIPEDLLNTGQLDYAWDDIMRATTPTEVISVVNEAGVEARRKETIATGSGWGKFWGTTIGLFSSPEYWPGMLWNPAGGITRTALELGAIATVETAAQEATLQSTQLTRSPYESFGNIGTALIGGTVFGGVIGKFIKPKQMKATSDEIGAEVVDISKHEGYRYVEDMPDEMPPITVENMGGRSAGAAEAGLGEGNMPIRGLRWGSGYISALRPLAKARVAEVHEMLNKYFGHDLQIKANAQPVMRWNPETQKIEPTGEVEHIAKPDGLSRQVEREVNRYEFMAERSLREGFFEYVGFQGKSRTIARIKHRGMYAEFNKKVDWAMRNNDVAQDPADVAVTKTAQRMRSEIYGPIEKEARRVDLLAKEEREQLKKSIKALQKQIDKSEDAAEVNRLTDDLKKAQEDLDTFEERTGDVKFADSYLNRRIHRENAEKNVDQLKKLLYKRYKEIREADAYKTWKDDLLEKIVLRKQRIVERKEKLAKKIEAEEKKIDTKQANIYKTKSPATVKTRQAELLKARKALIKLKEDVVNDKTLIRYQKEIDELEETLGSKAAEDFINDDIDFISDIKSDVADTYQKMLNGELLGDVWAKGAHNAKVFKERQLPLTDNELTSMDLLQTDMLDSVKAYVNSTLRPIRMKESAGDVEMSAEFKRVEDAYKAKIDAAYEAKDWDLHAQLGQEQNLNLSALEMVRDRYYGRTKIYEGRAATIANIARALRNLNVFRMMGGVLTTSINDVARLNAARIYTPELGSTGPGLVTAWKTLRKGVNKEALQEAGFAAETVNMLRLTKLVDMGVPILSGGRKSKMFLNMTATGAKALMKATLLTQWTDYMKMVAGVMVQNQTVFMMKNYSKLSAKNKTILAEMGIDERLAREVTEQFSEYGDQYGKYGTSLNWDDWADQDVARRMKNVMFRQSERVLVTPRETDLPLVISDNEMGRAFLQFKSFSLAAHNQTTVPMLERAQTGDLATVYAMAMMSVGALPTEILKMYEAGREDELMDYSPADWGLAIADRSAIAPMLSMAFNNIDLGLGNRVTKELNARPASRMTDRNILGVFGPTASTVGDLVRFTGGLAGNELDYRDARAGKRLLPFQNYMLLNRLSNSWLPSKKETKYSDR